MPRIQRICSQIDRLEKAYPGITACVKLTGDRVEIIVDSKHYRHTVVHTVPMIKYAFFDVVAMYLENAFASLQEREKLD